MRKVFTSGLGEQTFDVLDTKSEKLPTNQPVAYELQRTDHEMENGDQFEIKCDTPDVIDFGDSVTITPEMKELVFLSDGGFTRAGSFVLTVVRHHGVHPPTEVCSNSIDVIEFEEHPLMLDSIQDEEEPVISAPPATPDIMEELGMWDDDSEEEISDAQMSAIFVPDDDSDESTNNSQLDESEEALVPIPDVFDALVSQKPHLAAPTKNPVPELDLSAGYAEPFDPISYEEDSSLEDNGSDDIEQDTPHVEVNTEADPIPEFVDEEPATDEVERDSVPEIDELARSALSFIATPHDVEEEELQRPEIDQDVQDVFSRLNTDVADSVFFSEPNLEEEDLEAPETISETSENSVCVVEEEPSHQPYMDLEDLVEVTQHQGGDSINPDESRNDRVESFKPLDDELGGGDLPLNDGPDDRDSPPQKSWVKRNWIFFAVGIPMLLLMLFLLYMPIRAMNQMNSQAALSTQAIPAPTSSTKADNGAVVVNPVCTSNCASGNINNGTNGASGGVAAPSATNNVATPPTGTTSSGGASQLQHWKEWSGTPGD